MATFQEVMGDEISMALDEESALLPLVAPLGSSVAQGAAPHPAGCKLYTCVGASRFACMRPGLEVACLGSNFRRCLQCARLATATARHLGGASHPRSILSQWQACRSLTTAPSIRPSACQGCQAIATEAAFPGPGAISWTCSQQAFGGAAWREGRASVASRQSTGRRCSCLWPQWLDPQVVHRLCMLDFAPELVCAAHGRNMCQVATSARVAQWQAACV